MKDDITRSDELAGKLQFSELSDAEQSELDALLQRNPEARERFVSHLILENDLHEDAAGLLCSEKRVIPFKSALLVPLSIAAAVAVVGWFLFQPAGFGLNGGPSFVGQTEKDKLLSTSVGIVRKVVAVESMGDSVTLRENGVLYPGGLNVETGLVQLDLYSGVSLVVEGPAQLNLVSPDRVILNSGKVRANVPPPARGFRLVVGEHELIDWGTEFGVSVGADGDGELHVIDGEVEVSSEGMPEKEGKLLTTGTAVSLKSNGSALEIPVDGGKFLGTDALKKRGAARFERWEKSMDRLANDPDTIVLFDFTKGEDNRLRNLASDGDEGTAGIVIGCEVGEGRWAEKSSLDFRSTSDRVRVKIPGRFDHLTMASWVKVESIELLSLPFIQSESKQERSLFWVLHHDRIRKPMTAHFVDTTHPIGEKGVRERYFSGVDVLSRNQTGEWMHFAVTVDNDAKQVTHFVNGKAVAKLPIENPRPLGIGLADIGNWPSRDWATDTKWEVRHLIGKMDEFFVNQRAFTESEVLTLYKSGRP